MAKFPYINEDGSWNAQKATEDLLSLQSFMRLSSIAPKSVTELVLNSTHPQDDEEARKARYNAAEELKEILSNKDNKYGYHLNHIESGDKVYTVYYDDPALAEKEDCDKAVEYKEFEVQTVAEEFAEEKKKEGTFMYTIDNPREEFWVVIDNKTGKNVFGMMFPLEARALAFLYARIMPPAWKEYCEKVLDTKSTEEENNE